MVKPDLVAPGNLVVSALTGVRSPETLSVKFPKILVDRSYYSTRAQDADLYCRLSGTSMAAQVVSGTVALLVH